MISMMTSMITMTSMTTGLLESPRPHGDIGWLDLAAFLAMGLLWILVFAMLYAIYRILRSKARGDTDWGDSPGL